MKRLFALLLVPVALTSCSTMRSTFGMDQKAPDEFAVVERAPLTVPPDFNLAPPQPGAARPQETHPSAQAQDLLIGKPPATDKAMSPAEKALLSQAGASNTAPAIRQELNKPDDDQNDNGTVAQKLGISSSSSEPGKALDPVAESKRLKEKNTKAPDATAQTPSAN